MFLSSYQILWSHFQQLGKERILLSCIVKINVFAENLALFSVYLEEWRKFFYWFPFTRIFLLLNADKTFYLKSIFQLIYKKI